MYACHTNGKTHPDLVDRAAHMRHEPTDADVDEIERNIVMEAL